MNSHSLGSAVRRLRQALAANAGSDAALLDRFIADRDPVAFAGLVARYGPLVLGVCRRVLGDPHRAEDVFQATFLVLARKAATIRKRDAIGSWLYGVAYRLSRKARSRFAPVETPRARNVNALDDPAATVAWNDLLAALDQELHRLPDRLRAPLLLCYYEGCTQDEAASRLGWSFGTLRRRLDQARDLLRVRMTARGATLGAGLLATVLATRGATAAVPFTLTQTTVDAAGTFAVGGRVIGPVGDLAEEGLRMFGATKVRAGVALAVLVGGLAAGTGALFGVGRDEPTPPKDPPPAVKNDTPLPAGVVLKHGAPVFRQGSPILNVLVTPDDKTILTQGNRSVRMWDAGTGLEQGVALELPDDGANFWTASLTPDGKTLLTTRHNGTAQAWNLAGRKMTRSFPLAAPPFDVTEAKCVHSPDGRMIAVVTSDGSIRVCDVTAGKEMEQLRSHSDAVSAAVFSPDSKQLVLSSRRQTINTNWRVWDVATGQPITTMTWGSWLHNVTNLVSSTDGTWVAAAYSNPEKEGQKPETSVTVFGWNSPRPESHRLGGNSLADILMVFTPDGKYLLAPDRGSTGRILTQWDIGTGRAMRQYPAQRDPVTAMAFTDQGQTLITADSSLRFWNWKTGQPAGLRASDQGGERCYTLTPDGKAVVEGDMAGRVTVWDAATGKELKRFEAPRPDPDDKVAITAVAVSPDGKLLAAEGDGRPANENEPVHRQYIWVWEPSTGKLLHRLDNNADLIRSSREGRLPSVMTTNWLTFAPDSRTLVATGNGRSARAFDGVNGKEIADHPAQGWQNVRAVAFSANGTRMAAWEGPGISVRSVAAGDAPARFDRAGRSSRGIWPGGTWRAVAFSRDANWAAVGGKGNDGTGNLRVGSTGIDPDNRGFDEVRGLPRDVARIALTDDGKTVAVALAGENPPVLVFDVATGKELKRFTNLRGRATWLAFTPDGKRLFAASSDTTVLAWDTADVRQ